jgi:hypothetical protein
MGASQYHMNYSPDEDRIFIFVRDGETAEHAFGLTRRLFKKLWPVLGKTVQEMSEAATKTPPEMMKDVLQFEQQGAVSNAIQSGALSNAPVPEVENRVAYLVKTIRIRDSEGGGKIMTLSDDVKSMSIPISHEQLLVFCDALRTLAAKSDWNLTPLYPWESSDEAESEAVPAADSGLTRH